MWCIWTRRILEANGVLDVYMRNGYNGDMVISLADKETEKAYH